jgi:hypothetical protein
VTRAALLDTGHGVAVSGERLSDLAVANHFPSSPGIAELVQRQRY